MGLKFGITESLMILEREDGHLNVVCVGKLEEQCFCLVVKRNNKTVALKPDLFLLLRPRGLGFWDPLASSRRLFLLAARRPPLLATKIHSKLPPIPVHPAHPQVGFLSPFTLITNSTKFSMVLMLKEPFLFPLLGPLPALPGSGWSRRFS